jgi:non-ribosomal peptide synthetase component F
VPIDPQFPRERQVFMIRDCAARAVLVRGAAAVDPAAFTAPVIDVTQPRIARRSRENVRTAPQGNPVAYVMYTSGSTGEPKGVVIEHRAVNRLVINNGYAQIEPGDCIAHCSNPAFDASTFEIWGALLNGARICVVPHEQVLDPLAFARTLTAAHANVLFVTTALFNEYADSVPELFAGLKYLLFGGEIADAARVRCVSNTHAPRNLLHVYGPTESTTFATFYRVERYAGEQAPPIGRPI